MLLQVMGMYQDSNGDYCYKVKENNKLDVLTREELIAKDPVALLLFYESRIKMTKN